MSQPDCAEGQTAAAQPQACPAAAPDGCQFELGWGLTMLTRGFTQWAADAVSELPGGLRGHLVLASISQGQQPSQVALAQQLGVDRTVMTYLLDELERAGYLERRRDPLDRRARHIVITEAGKTALGSYRTRVDAAEARLLAPLSESESATFRSAVQRIARASLQAADSGCAPPA